MRMQLVCLSVWLTVIVNSSSANMISYWRFDDDVTDAHGSNHGTAVGSPTYTTGKFGKAIQLNGTKHVYVNDSTSLDPGTQMTFSLWAKVTSNNDDIVRRGVRGSGVTTKYVWALYSSGSKYLYAYMNGGDPIANTTSSSWQSSTVFRQIVMTYDGALTSDDLKIYVNGSEVAKATGGAGVNAGSQQLNFAREGTYGTRTLDDATFFNKAWTAGEVKAAYNLANNAGLKYDTGQAWSLFALFRSGSGRVAVGEMVWTRASLPSGTAGELVDNGNGSFTLYLESATGLVGAVPKAGTLIMVR